MGKAILRLCGQHLGCALPAGTALSPSHCDMSEKTKGFFLPNTTPFDHRKPVVPETEAGGTPEPRCSGPAWSRQQYPVNKKEKKQRKAIVYFVFNILLS